MEEVVSEFRKDLLISSFCNKENFKDFFIKLALTDIPSAWEDAESVYGSNASGNGNRSTSGSAFGSI